MTQDNNIKVGTVLHIVTTVLLAVMGYLWTVSQEELYQITCRLRAVELNTMKLLTMHDAETVAAYQLPWPEPGEAVTVELVITDSTAAAMPASPEPPQSQIDTKSDARQGASVLRKPGPS